MKRTISGLAALSLGLLGLPAALTASPALAASSSPAPFRQPMGSASHGGAVIVVLRQHFSFPGTVAGARERTEAADVAQAPVLSSLRASHATHVTQLHLIDAVSATVTAAEARKLAASPAVSEVVPDASFQAQHLAQPTSARQAAASLAPGVCPAPGQVQLNPEGVELVHAVSDDPSVPTARSLGFDGAGVTVGDIAVGIDPNETELIRPDGQRVIKVYKDFTGEGTELQGGEDLESYLDDSIMAAQGAKVYDLHDYTDLPAGCDIKLQGVAPGMTLDAYKVYGNDYYTTTSAFLEAIDYAVNVNHVNVLNEEGGSFPMPDTSQDLIKDANAAAMAAGVTITSPSYDAGPESTIWSPSSQPGVISVGASTAFRSYAQADIGEYDAVHAQGWVSDNISSLSSGGSTENGRSIDVVAPGDLDWIACEAGTAACGNTDLTVSGGTSESGPLVAAIAALVIQAYRSTHDGATPTTDQVRDIISSSADDLGMPASEQGSGLADAYRAVKAAETAAGATPGAGAGGGLVASEQQLDATGDPGTEAQSTFTLTNEGSQPATATLAGRTSSAQTTVYEKALHVNWGSANVDQIVHFAIPKGADQLTADIAYPGGDNPNAAAITLVNPAGQLTAYSLPQGTGNHGQVEVRDPAAGTWTADISGADYTGPMHVQVTTAKLRSWGSVSPSSVSLAPGASTQVTVTGAFPASPGDLSAAVTMSAPGWGGSSLPITLRSLVPVTNGVGHFHTTLIGGNGRGFVPAQTFFYNVDVPAGEPALDVQTKLAGTGDDPYYTYLIDPDGDAVAQASNQVVVKNLTEVGEPGARLHTIDPPAGRWTIIITFTNPVTGNALTTPLSGTVSYKPVTAVAHGLPDAQTTRLARGSTYTATVKVHNSGDAAEAYFLDARLFQVTTMKLTSITPSQNIVMPMPYSDPYPQWIVPTDTTSLSAKAVSTAPTTFDFSPFNGEPDIGATVSGNKASATVTADPGDQLTQGDWDIVPQQIGPFNGQKAAPSTTSLSLVALTRAFDPAVASGTGDLWKQSAQARAAFDPVIVQPGQTATLYLTIKPTAPVNTEVSGTLYLDDSSAVTNIGPSPSGDQLTAIPYTYTVAPAS